MTEQWRYTCTVKVKIDFTFKPETIGLYNINEIEEAASIHLKVLVDDFDGFGINDKYELIEIYDRKNTGLITFEAEFKTSVDVWESEDGNDLEASLQDIFEDTLVSYDFVPNEQIN